MESKFFAFAIQGYIHYVNIERVDVLRVAADGRSAEVWIGGEKLHADQPVDVASLIEELDIVGKAGS